jgi:hypothetical protein
MNNARPEKYMVKLYAINDDFFTKDKVFYDKIKRNPLIKLPSLS